MELGVVFAVGGMLALYTRAKYEFIPKQCGPYKSIPPNANSLQMHTPRPNMGYLGITTPWEKLSGRAISPSIFV